MRFPRNHVLHLKRIIAVLSLKGGLPEVVYIFNIPFLFMWYERNMMGEKSHLLQ